MTTASTAQVRTYVNTKTAVDAQPAGARAGVVPEVVRVLYGLTGYGAALLYLAVGSTALLSSSEHPGVRAAVVIASLGWALALTLWGTAVLRSSQRSWPSFTRIMVPVAVTVTLAAVLRNVMFEPLGERSLDVTALCAVALGLVILSCRGYLQRRPATSSADVAKRPPPAGRLLLGLAGASVLVASIAAPGLAASTAGDFAVPHSEHGQNQQPVLPETEHHH